MQHNLQDLLRYGTHFLHTSQQVVKGGKRDLIQQMNVQEMYQFECYDQQLKNLSTSCSESPSRDIQGNQQQAISSSSTSVSPQSTIESYAFNPVSYFHYMEDQGRKMTKLRILDQEDSKSQTQEHTMLTVQEDNKNSVAVQPDRMFSNKAAAFPSFNPAFILSNVSPFKPSTDKKDKTKQEESTCQSDKQVTDSAPFYFQMSAKVQPQFEFQQNNQANKQIAGTFGASLPQRCRFYSDTQQDADYFSYSEVQSVDDARNAIPGGAQQLGESKSFMVKYKTEMCRNWELFGYCEFNQSCSFAHGIWEIQKKQHVPNNYKTKLCKQYHENLYCPYGVRCQFVHSEQKPLKQQEQNYTERLRINTEIAKQKINSQLEHATPSNDTQSSQQVGFSVSSQTALKLSKKKLKSSIEELFGKGKRLPIFSGITVNKIETGPVVGSVKAAENGDPNKLKQFKKQKGFNKKQHKFAKQKSEQIKKTDIIMA